jgi:O-antigen ligase
LGSFGLLLATKSRTSLAGLVVAVLVVQCVRLTRGTALLALGVCWLASTLALAAVLIHGEWRPPTGFLLLGRADPEETATLTGRTELWEALDDYMEKRPLMGYGYGGFWTPARVENVSEGQGWGVGVPDAHSLYYDLVLNVGLIGAGAYLVAAARFGVRAAVQYFATGEADGGLLVGLLVFVLVLGGSESAGMEVSCVTFVAASGIGRLAFFNPGPRILSVSGGRTC